MEVEQVPEDHNGLLSPDDDQAVAVGLQTQNAACRCPKPSKINANERR